MKTVRPQILAEAQRAIEEAIRQAVVDERERCAQVANEAAKGQTYKRYAENIGWSVARQIELGIRNPKEGG